MCTSEAGSARLCNGGTCIATSGTGTTVVNETPCDENRAFTWQRLSEGVLLLDKGPYANMRNIRGAISDATFTTTADSQELTL